ncbi:Maltose O-acetyltransferase [Paramyrothecium foliicola]|nr:Maltose O-acetyltransferase [Paramyrothecium foliicola]
MLTNIDEDENLARMRAGELYFAFTPKLVAARQRCNRAVRKFNNAEDCTRRLNAEHWKNITNDDRPLPPQGADDEQEDAILHEYPWIEPPLRCAYGSNVKVGSNVFINSNCVMIDTCTISIGSRTMLAPNVSLYSGGHPLDPEVRNGTFGPEYGKPITVGEDCWIGGNVTILPGVTIGDGCTIGAGSVVTKNVPPYHVAVGNPARIVKKLDLPKSKMESEGPENSRIAGLLPISNMLVDSQLANAHLLPNKITSRCAVCDDAKDVFAFSLWPTTSGCTHKQATCRSCLNDSIAFDIENKGANHVACPECGLGLGYDDVMRFADDEVRVRYEQLLVRTALQDNDEFVWCSASGCENGQIHLGGDAQPIVKCMTCGGRTCFTHGIPWHSGLSCEEYDVVQSSKSGAIIASSLTSHASALTAASLTEDLLRAIEDERATQSTIKSTTKPCPRCGKNIEKNGGWFQVVSVDMSSAGSAATNGLIVPARVPILDNSEAGWVPCIHDFVESEGRD